MRRVLPLLLLPLVFAACRARETPHSAQEPAAHAEMRTIETADPRPAILDPPLTLTDEGPAPNPKQTPGSPDAPAPLSERDEQARAQLPFVPAIAMDPVDGSKISIRADTPKLEYKNRIFYFSDDANRRIFQANPEQFMKGSFSRL
jgi:YHS domain-containing protein